MKKANQTLNAVSRRTFLKRAGAVAGGAVAAPYFIPARALGRDGAVAPVQFPPRDFCLASLGLLELDLDPADVLPPMKSARPESGPIVR